MMDAELITRLVAEGGSVLIAMAALVVGGLVLYRWVLSPAQQRAAEAAQAHQLAAEANERAAEANERAAASAALTARVHKETVESHRRMAEHLERMADAALKLQTTVASDIRKRTG